MVVITRGIAVVTWALGISVYRPCDCLLQSFSRLTTKKSTKLRYITDSLVISRFTVQRASNPESVSMPWRHQQYTIVFHDEGYHLMGVICNVRGMFFEHYSMYSIWGNPSTADWGYPDISRVPALLALYCVEFTTLTLISSLQITRHEWFE